MTLDRISRRFVIQGNGQMDTDAVPIALHKNTGPEGRVVELETKNCGTHNNCFLLFAFRIPMPQPEKLEEGRERERD